MKTFTKEIFRSITHSKSRFWAIFAIVALGAGFFAGLRSSAADMRATADKYYDASNFMDVRIVSTLGLTDDDAVAISKIPGIRSVMPAHSADVISKIGGMEQIFRVHSIATGGPKETESSMNRPQLTSGRWPQNDRECVVGARRNDQSLVKIGDSITVSSQDGSQKDQLKYDSYKIVGVVSNSYYICFNLGTTEIGNGELNYYMYIPDSGFNQSVYTELFATVDNGAEKNTFSTEYSDLVSPVVSSLKTLAKDREQIRYEDVYNDAKKQLDDGKAEYDKNKADADKALSDAAKKIADGEKEIAANEKKLDDAQKQVNAGKVELQKGQADLAANRATLEDGLAQLSAGKKELDSSKAQLESGLAELAKQKSQTEAQLKQAELAIGSGYPGAPATREEFEKMKAAAMAQLNAAQAKLDDSSAQLNEGYAQWNKQQQKLASAQAQLAAGEKKLEESRKTLTASQAKITSGKKELAAAKTDLAKGKTEYETNKAKADKEFADAAKKISDGEADLKKLENRFGMFLTAKQTWVTPVSAGMLTAWIRFRPYFRLSSFW